MSLTIQQILKTDMAFPVILAPMAGVTDLPYRIICTQNGCDFTYSEMVSAKALEFNNKSTFSLIKSTDDIESFGVQLFGHDPDVMADMAALLCSTLNDKLALIDINMGCPAPKIISNGDGCSLMLNPSLAQKIIMKTSRTAKVPVTVKFRKGYSENYINALEFAKIAEDSGACAITIHGRTGSQMYSGIADWDIIRQIKKQVKIPVIGNGDVFSGENAIKLLKYTECDAIMVGRGAQGNPFIFNEIKCVLSNSAYTPPTAKEKLQMAMKHAALHVAHKGESSYIELRKHLAWYTKSIKNATELRRRINECRSYAEMNELLCKLIDSVE